MAKRKIIKPEKREWWQEFHEDIRQKEKPEKGGKGSKMSKKVTAAEAVSKATTTKKYAKTRGEHTKDLIIAILVTGVVAFGFGMHFEGQHNAEMQKAVSAAALTVKK